VYVDVKSRPFSHPGCSNNEQCARTRPSMTSTHVVHVYRTRRDCLVISSEEPDEPDVTNRVANVSSSICRPKTRFGSRTVLSLPCYARNINEHDREDCRRLRSVVVWSSSSGSAGGRRITRRHETIVFVVL